MYGNRHSDEIWFFKPANGDGLRVPIKVKRHDVKEVKVSGVTDNAVFSEFAANEFPRAISCYHTTESLSASLLPLTNQVDQHVAIVLSSTILRFMGDMPEPRHTFLDTTALEETTAEGRGHVYSSKSWMSTIDKLRFIVGLGINRPHLRDEIYCQLCKQVTNNPSNASLAKGWILLSLCFGCFIPSKEVEKVVVSVMRFGPDDYASYCDKKMARTKKNGARKQPPNSLELQAAQQKRFPLVPVELNDGRELMFEIDSSTTAKELCVDAADEMGCDHISGYGIQISMLDKHIYLGSGSEKLMDAIWLCEQSARELGHTGNSTMWKIYYRKDVFTPLDEFLVDVNWTDFAYHFVVGGIKTGVNRLKKRFHSPEKLGHETQNSSMDVYDEVSLPSPSSIGTLNDFGAPSCSDSGSDISNVEFCQENNNPSGTETSTLQKICKPYSDSSCDIHTLKTYARKNFSSSDHIKNWKQHGALSTMWSHQLEPITQPVLLRLLGNQELSKIAVDMFSAVLEFMEKCSTPSSSKFYKMELIRRIFAPAVRQELLKDELYCQVLKQLTNNDDKDSLLHGWQLLLLCTRLFTCSDELLKEVMLFLVSWSNHEVIAMTCLTSLRKTVQTGPRLYPPHFVEFAAASKRCDSILHKISFPDLTSKNFDVDSRTKVKDIINNIGQRLSLSCLDGYSLFIQVFSKIVVLDPEDFIFDAIQQWSEAVERILSKPVIYNKAKGIPYKLLFLRRLWNSVSPGNDPIADAMFLYPQELFKYLRGYYKLSIEDVSYLAALILKLESGENSNCPEITNMFDELLPHRMIEELFPEIWRRYILVNYQNIMLTSQCEIRKEFLITLQKKDRFGSAFFTVGQRHFSDAPKLIIIGVNCKAIYLIHPLTKEAIHTIPVQNIVSHYKEVNTYVVQVQMNIDKLETYRFYTTQDFEIANMVASYIPK